MPTYTAFDWYAEPRYYDMVFDTETQKEAAFLEAVYARHVNSSGRQVLEPACGTARLLAELAKRRYVVTGFDNSPAMLRYARSRIKRRGVKAKLKEADLSEFSFGKQRFDMAFCLLSSFRHILNPELARRHLQAVADHLKPGGVYVLGLHITRYNDQTWWKQPFDVQRGSTRVVCNMRTWPPCWKTRTEQMRARFIVHRSGTTRYLECVWRARVYTCRELKQLIRSDSRWEIVGCYSFDHDITQEFAFDGQQYDNVLVLRKKEAKNVALDLPSHRQ